MTSVRPPVGIGLSGISKRYGGAIALNDVSVTVAPGTIHGLVGENGAGKSTLGKIIAGAVIADKGEISVGGRHVAFRSPREAIREGIALIHQEIALVPALSVIDNVFLGVEAGSAGLLDRRAQRQRLEGVAGRIGFTHSPDTLVETLRVADQQKVEIMRALARDARILVMDEPTAALTGQETAALIALARDLRSDGVTIIFVSHFLKDVLTICDTVTVLKEGRHIKTGPAAAETVESLVLAMLGRKLDVVFPPKSPPAASAPIRLSVRGLTRRPSFQEISLDIRAGEIVGLAGLVGAGRTEVARAIFGADPSEGEVQLDGEPLLRRNPRKSIRNGIGLLPESRKDQGLVMIGSVQDNVSLVHLAEMTRLGFVSRTREVAKTKAILDRVDARVPSMSMPVSGLSGGNQQKVAIARWLIRTPRVMIIDEPTRGIDIGAKRAIYELIHQLASEGLGVLLVSSEIEEMLGLAHRVIVLHAGRMTGEFAGEDMTEEAIMRAAFDETTLTGGMEP